MEDLAHLQISFRCVHLSDTPLCKDEDNASIERSGKSPIIFSGFNALQLL
jgi:hypothetical protein